MSELVEQSPIPESIAVNTLDIFYHLCQSQLLGDHGSKSKTSGGPNVLRDRRNHGRSSQ